MPKLNLTTEPKQQQKAELNPLLLEALSRRKLSSSEQYLAKSLANPFSHLYIAILITLHRQLLTQLAIQLADEQAMIQELTKLIKHHGIFKLDEIFALTDGFQLDKLQALLDRHHKLKCDQHYQMTMESATKKSDLSLKTLNAILKQKHCMLCLQDGLSILA